MLLQSTPVNLFKNGSSLSQTTMQPINLIKYAIVFKFSTCMYVVMSFSSVFLWDENISWLMTTLTEWCWWRGNITRALRFFDRKRLLRNKINIPWHWVVKLWSCGKCTRINVSKTMRGSWLSANFSKQKFVTLNNGVWYWRPHFAREHYRFHLYKCVYRYRQPRKNRGFETQDLI